MTDPQARDQPWRRACIAGASALLILATILLASQTSGSGDLRVRPGSSGAEELLESLKTKKIEVPSLSARTKDQELVAIDRALAAERSQARAAKADKLVATSALHAVKEVQGQELAEEKVQTNVQAKKILEPKPQAKPSKEVKSGAKWSHELKEVKAEFLQKIKDQRVQTVEKLRNEEQEALKKISKIKAQGQLSVGKLMRKEEQAETMVMAEETEETLKRQMKKVAEEAQARTLSLQKKLEAVKDLTQKFQGVSGVADALKKKVESGVQRAEKSAQTSKSQTLVQAKAQVTEGSKAKGAEGSNAQGAEGAKAQGAEGSKAQEPRGQAKAKGPGNQGAEGARGQKAKGPSNHAKAKGSEAQEAEGLSVKAKVKGPGGQGPDGPGVKVQEDEVKQVQTLKQDAAEKTQAKGLGGQKAEEPRAQETKGPGVQAKAMGPGGQETKRLGVQAKAKGPEGKAKAEKSKVDGAEEPAISRTSQRLASSGAKRSGHQLRDEERKQLRDWVKTPQDAEVSRDQGLSQGVECSESSCPLSSEDAKTVTNGKEIHMLMELAEKGHGPSKAKAMEAVKELQNQIRKDYSQVHSFAHHQEHMFDQIQKDTAAYVSQKVQLRIRDGLSQTL